MASSSPAAPARYECVAVARTDGRFVDFAPFVPSIDRHERVAFCASLVRGGSGIFRSAGNGEIETLAESDGIVAQFISHPDVNDDGAFCAYAKLHYGEDALVVGRPDAPLRTFANRRDTFARIGPLGPTMNERGDVAFRGTTPDGQAAVFALYDAEVTRLASAAVGSGAGFHGLPAIDGRGRVVIRAELASGARAIVRADRDGLTTLVATGDGFAELARFPCVNEAGVIVFAGVRPDGASGVFRVDESGDVTQVVDGAPFASLRGALVDDEGHVLFFATPHGGALGVYDATAQRIVGIGDALFESIVAELALNPVSINGRGDVALRVRVADGGQAILRLDRVGRLTSRASRST